MLPAWEGNMMELTPVLQAIVIVITCMLIAAGISYVAAAGDLDVAKKNRALPVIMGAGAGVQ